MELDVSAEAVPEADADALVAMGYPLWRHLEGETGDGRAVTHIYPLNDVWEHTLSDECWCNPVVDESPGSMVIVAHASADHREQYETGARKPH